jgi:hypothetical protein
MQQKLVSLSETCSSGPLGPFITLKYSLPQTQKYKLFGTENLADLKKLKRGSGAEQRN